ncbi:MAG: hypothetical protein IT301_04105 [Dehalococcoidia bacterium]|nr:hypothetical protein [Dehalococcoidia bacterium]
MIRIDHYLEDLYLPSGSPSGVAAALVKPVGIWPLKEGAEEDAVRLLTLNGSKGVEYVVKATDSAVGSTQAEAYTVLRVDAGPERRVLTSSDIDLVGVFDSQAEAGHVCERSERHSSSSFAITKVGIRR